MSETSSSLVVAEKRPQRPGGCVGIFYQLLDWNRRLAKKKLFSTKLLPAARAKRAAKKFGGDEKLPMAKLLLIADENRGGFPNAVKPEFGNVKSRADAERSREMRSPGLVARLMGLESIPSERRDKPKKVALASPEFYHERENKFRNNHSCVATDLFDFDGEDNGVEKGHGRLESRPQKLQKTGLFDRRQVTRFGAEALQLKSVLSRSRKHHPKLASPVKSPRVIPGRKSTRLIGAATRILEPGLQASNRAKCALTYSPYLVNPPKDDVLMEETSHEFSDQTRQQIFGSAKSMKGQASCNSCGNFLDVMDFRTNEERKPGFRQSTSDSDGAPCQGLSRSNSKTAIFSREQEKDIVSPARKDHPMSLNGQAQAGTRIRNENVASQRVEVRESQDQHRMPSQNQRAKLRNEKLTSQSIEVRQSQFQHRMSSQNQHAKPLKGVAPSTVSKPKAHKHHQVPSTKDRVPPRQKISNLSNKRDLFVDGSTNGAKDFVSLNRNSGSQSRSRVPSKVLDKVDMERKHSESKHDSSSRIRVPIRKGRSMNGSKVENADTVQSTFGKRRNDVGGATTRKGAVGPNTNIVSPNHVLSKCPRQAQGNVTADRGDDVVSFTFSSPLRHNTESPSPGGTSRNTRTSQELRNCNSSQNELNFQSSCSQMKTQLTGDALGALLEEKLRELTGRERDWESGDDLPGKSTASILQELISALTIGKVPSHDDQSTCSSHNDSLSCGSQDSPGGMSTHGRNFNTNRNYKDTKSSAGFPFGGDNDHLSPGSVLEASFSNDSCFSDSLDGSSGHKFYPESTQCSYSRAHLSTSPDADILDSATSLSTGKARNIDMSGNLKNTSKKSYGLDPADIGLDTNQLSHVKNAISNFEMLLESAPLFDLNEAENFKIVSHLLHKLENLFKCSTILVGADEGYQLRRFLFDHVIEWLDSKYSHYCESGFKTWQKLPLHVSTESLTREVSKYIKGCTMLAGKTSEEILENDMSHCNGKWTSFEVEECGIGSEIEWDILKSLMDEMVVELAQ